MTKPWAERRLNFKSKQEEKRYKRFVKRKKRWVQQMLVFIEPSKAPTYFDVFGCVWYGDHVKVTKVGGRFFVYTPFETGYRR